MTTELVLFAQALDRCVGLAPAPFRRCDAKRRRTGAAGVAAIARQAASVRIHRRAFDRRNRATFTVLCHQPHPHIGERPARRQRESETESRGQAVRRATMQHRHAGRRWSGVDSPMHLSPDQASIRTTQSWRCDGPAADPVRGQAVDTVVDVTGGTWPRHAYAKQRRVRTEVTANPSVRAALAREAPTSPCPRGRYTSAPRLATCDYRTRPVVTGMALRISPCDRPRAAGWPRRRRRKSGNKELARRV